MTRSGKVYMESPDGKERAWVEPSKVKGFLAKGGRVININAAQRAMMTAGDLAVPVGSIGGSIAGGAGGAVLGAPGGPLGVGAGGMAGRFAGGVAGGTAGQAAREGLYRMAGQPDAPGTVAGEIPNQMVAGAAGEALGGATGLIGRGVIRTGLPARLQDEWKAVGEMVKERLPVGGVNFGPFKSGGRKAGENLSRKTAARDAANTAAANAGVEIQARPMEQKMMSLVNEYQLRGDRSSQLSALSKRMDDFIETWRAGKLSPPDAQKYLSSLDEEAKNLWKAEHKMGQYVPEAERRGAQQAKQIAATLRAEFRRLVPNHRATSAALSGAASAKNAIDEAEHMGMLSLGSRLATGAMLGAGVEQFADPNKDAAGYATKAGVGLMLAHPSASSRLGMFLTNPLLLNLLRQGPRAVSRQEGQ